MATYFGYVEREADSYVNWADVGRNMSATIDNIQRVRDEKKTLIEKAYREDLDFIQANPSGQHETINGWSLNFGNTSAENLKLKYSQLKQGKISVNDFVTFRQNLTDSVEKIYGVTGRLQEIYKDVEERTMNQENQLIERETKVLLEKYGQLENTLPYVNGLTGSVAIGLTEIVEEDGKKVRKLRQGEGSYLTPQQLQAAAEEKFNNFDEQKVINAWVEKTGTVQQDIRSLGGESVAGLITSVADITYDNISVIIDSMPEDKRPAKEIIEAIKGYAKDFEEAEKLFIDGMVAKPTDASAILTEKIGIDPNTKKPYTIVWDKKDATSSDKLYVEKSSDGSGRLTPVFDVNATKDEEKYQMNAIKNYLKSQIRVKLDRTVKMNPYNEPTPPRPIVQGGNYDAREAGERKSYIDQFEMYHKLFTGKFDVKQTILQNFKQAAKVLSDETLYNDKTGELIITPSDPDKEKIVYNFKNPPVGVDTRDLVFSLMNLIDPALNSKYGAYAKSVPIKEIDTTLPIDNRIQTAQENLDFLKNEKEKGGLLSSIYAGQIPDAEKTLKDLKDEQKGMRQGDNQGGSANRFTKPK